MAYKKNDCKYKRLDVMIHSYLEDNNLHLKDFLERIEMSYVTFYRKMDGINKSSFTIEELMIIFKEIGCERLSQELAYIFEDFSGRYGDGEQL